MIRGCSEAAPFLEMSNADDRPRGLVVARVIWEARAAWSNAVRPNGADASKRTELAERAWAYREGEPWVDEHAYGDDRALSISR